MNEKRSTWMHVLVAALMALLPVLAWLQYRWIGQISRDEEARMHASLDTRVDQFAEDVDRALQDVTRTFRIPPSDDLDVVTHSLANAFLQWEADASDPALVDDVFFVTTRDEDPARLYRFDIDAVALQPTAWPAELDDWQAVFDDPTWQTGFAGPPSAPWTAHPALVNAVVKPFSLSATLGRPATQGGQLGYVFILLDSGRLEESFLPGLVRRHFSDDGDLAYDVAIVDEDSPSDTLFAAGRHPFDGPPDATSVLDVARPTFQLSLPAADSPSSGSLQGAVRVTLDHIINTRRTREWRVYRFTPDAGATDTALRAHHVWRVNVRHRAGSLAAVVARTRLRNLSISFGILFVLGVATLLIYLSSQRARRLAQQQMAFVAGVSHELRTPLAVIRSAAENLADGVVGDAEHARRYGALIDAEGRRLTDMVDQVLELAGALSGHARYDLGAVAVAEALDEALTMLAGPLTDDGFTLERDVAPGLPPVHADDRALQAAIRNLIANAMKYGQGARWIGVAARYDDDGGEVLLTVSDRGPGIPADELAHVFKPFFRGRQARDAQIRGNGLGLSLVDHAVRAFGGRASVTSKPGEGAAFTLHLPVAPSPVAAGPAP